MYVADAVQRSTGMTANGRSDADGTQGRSVHACRLLSVHHSPLAVETRRGPALCRKREREGFARDCGPRHIVSPHRVARRPCFQCI